MILLFCTFPLRIPKIALLDPFGTPKSLQNRPRDASLGAQVAPRWRPNWPLNPQDGRPGEPQALQTAFQTVQEPILNVPGPSKPRFWPPGTNFASNLEVPSVILDAQAPETNFPAPKHPFSTPDFPLPQSSMPAGLQASELGTAECAERLNKIKIKMKIKNKKVIIYKKK